MHRQRIHRILGSLFSICLLFALLTGASNLFERTDSKVKYHEFYQYADEYDVLFLGSSHVLNGFIPMELWNSYGITSYNLGFSGSRIAMNYWVLENVLQYTQPKLVILDCAYLKDEKASTNKNYNHAIFDDMRHLPTKIRAIFDLFDSAEDRLRYLFPLSIYHNRWSTFVKEEESPVVDRFQHGFSGLSSVVPATLPSFSSSEMNPVENFSVIYLRKLIEKCLNENIELILTFLPYNANEVSLNDAAFIQHLANEYQVMYLSPSDFLSVLNPEVDFANNYEDNSHLNLSGAQKTTQYIGHILSSSFNLSDHRNDSTYAHWHDRYIQYTSQAYASLQKHPPLEEYLISLQRLNLNVIIQADNRAALYSQRLAILLQNLGISYDSINENTEILVADRTQNISSAYTHYTELPSIHQPAIDQMLSHGYDTLADNELRIILTDPVSNAVIDSRLFSVNELVSPDVINLLVQHNQETPEYAYSTDAFLDKDLIYVLSDHHLYGFSNSSIKPAITMEEASKAYWYADHWSPKGYLNDEESTSSKRTNIIPVTPGDQLAYRGIGKHATPSVVWLDADSKYLFSEQYDTPDESIVLTVPDGAYYAWFSSFVYGPLQKVVLDVRWIHCQAVPLTLEWTDLGYIY